MGRWSLYILTKGKPDETRATRWELYWHQVVPSLGPSEADHAIVICGRLDGAYVAVIGSL